MITPRTRRFLEMFFVKFCIYAGVVLLGGAIGSAIGYLIIMAAFKFGAFAVMTGFLIFWITALIAVMAGKAAEEKLIEQEYQEQQLMKHLRNTD